MHYLMVCLAYLLGSIPFGLVFGRLAGIDVRAAGSGNIGATNVNRLLGKKMGFLTLVADAGKGVVPMLLATWWLPEAAGKEEWILACGAAAFLGHIFPLYLKFKGGKGVATALGIFLYLNPWLALLTVVVFVGVVAVWGYVSLGSLVAAAVLPGLLWLLHGWGAEVALALVVALLVWWKHRSNIIRLLRHEEKSWKKCACRENEA